MTMNESFFILVRIYSGHKLLNYFSYYMLARSRGGCSENVFHGKHRGVFLIGKKNRANDSVQGIIVSRLADSKVKI